MLEFTVVIDAKDVPDTAMKTIRIRKSAEGVTIERIEHVEIIYDIKGGKTIKLAKPVIHYAIEMAKGNQHTEIVVDPNGVVMEPAKWSPTERE
jgi:hypothetical protein